MLRLVMLIIVCCVLSPSYANAGVASQAVKAAARKLAGEAAEGVAKNTAKRLASLATAKAGKEAAEAVAQRTATLTARHFGQVAAHAPTFADNFAKAATKMTARNERRLLMLAPKLNESGQSAAVMARLANGNADEIIETFWKHKEKLASAAAVTALLVHGDDVVKAGGKYVAKPVIEGTMANVVAPVSRLFVSGVILTVLIGMVGLAAYLFGGEATERVTGIARQLLNLIGRQR